MVTQPKKHFFYRMYDKAMFSIMHDAIAGLQSSHQARAALPRDALYKSRSCDCISFVCLSVTLSISIT